MAEAPRRASSAAALENRVALVTGASRGIGKAVALTLGEAGAAVAVNYRDRSQDAEAVVDTIRANGGRAIAIAADVADAAAVTRMVGEIEQQLGAVDVLVNNAGISLA